MCLINDPRDGHGFNKLYTVQYLGNVVGGHSVRYINVSIDVLKKAAADAIKLGQVCVMSSFTVVTFEVL